MRVSGRPILVSVSLLGLLLPMAAAAQGAAEPSAADGADAGEIIVTARKRGEALSKVPETIQAVSSETLTRAGITDINALGRLTPNTVLSRRQDNETNIVIRGVGSFGNTQGIGFYIDDVQNFTDQSPNMQDVERVEILKGPQGTLYGGSNVGGAVKFVMKKPHDAFGVEGQIEAGGFDTLNLHGAVNAAISENGELAARISAYHSRSDGYITNSFLGEKADKSKETGVRLALGWKPSPDFELQIAYRHSELDNGGNVYVPADNVEDYNRETRLSDSVSNERTIDGVIVQADYTPGTVRFTSITSFTRRKNNFLWDLDYSPAAGVTATNGARNKGKIYTQELRVASDGGGPFDWIVGGYVSRLDNRVLTNNANLYLGVDHPSYGDLAPVFGVTPPDPVPLIDFNNADVTETQYAAFANVNYDFGSLRVGGGVRLNRYEYTGRRLNEGQTIFNNDTKILPKLSLAYDIADDVMFYANLARGMEPGRANVIGDFNDPFRPETAWNYEAGIKGRAFDRLLSFEIAAFYIDYKDRQQEVQILDPTQGVIELTSNIGDTRSYGIEGSISLMPVDGLTLSLGGGWLDSKWKNGSIAVPDPASPGDFIALPLQGLDVPNSPEFSANGSIDYRIAIGGDLEAGLRADWTHGGNFYWDLRNRGRQDAYDVVNLGLSFGAADQRWRLGVRVENLLKAKYYNEFNYAIFGDPDAAGDCDGCSLGAPGAPRRAMASASFKF
jgi:outer membrane receptor protein involved in Fe transport